MEINAMGNYLKEVASFMKHAKPSEIGSYDIWITAPNYDFLTSKLISMSTSWFIKHESVKYINIREDSLGIFSALKCIHTSGNGILISLPSQVTDLSVNCKPFDVPKIFKQCSKINSLICRLNFRLFMDDDEIPAYDKVDYDKKPDYHKVDYDKLQLSDEKKIVDCKTLKFFSSYEFNEDATLYVLKVFRNIQELNLAYCSFSERFGRFLGEGLIGLKSLIISNSLFSVDCILHKSLNDSLINFEFNNNLFKATPTTTKCNHVFIEKLLQFIDNLESISLVDRDTIFDNDGSFFSRFKKLRKLTLYECVTPIEISLDIPGLEELNINFRRTNIKSTSSLSKLTLRRNKDFFNDIKIDPDTKTINDCGLLANYKNLTSLSLIAQGNYSLTDILDNIATLQVLKITQENYQELIVNVDTKKSYNNITTLVFNCHLLKNSSTCNISENLTVLEVYTHFNTFDSSNFNLAKLKHLEVGK